MNSDQEILARLRSYFQQLKIDQCLDKRSDTILVICETGIDNTPCHFGQLTNKGFRIENPDQLEIHLLKVDHCLLTNIEQNLKKCDCIIFDSRFFCFVELKLNTTRQLSEAIKEAIIQLEATIRYLEQELQADEQFFGFIREAYIAMPEPKPSLLASFQNRQAKFVSKNKVMLFLGSAKRFARSALKD